MSVLIKGMDIPKKCGECPFSEATADLYCNVYTQGESRPYWCPLKEVRDLTDGDPGMSDGNEVITGLFTEFWKSRKKFESALAKGKKGRVTAVWENGYMFGIDMATHIIRRIMERGK